MKKPIILAVGTVFLIWGSIIFYYKNVELPNFVEKDETIIADSLNKENNHKNEINKKENKKASKEESKNFQQEEKNKNDAEPSKDISICNENGKIMVLMYHKFADTAKDAWTRSFSDFKNDLKMLYEKNYYPINMSEYINGNINVPYGKTPVILTFDDGVASQLSFEWKDDVLTAKKDTAVSIYEEFSKEHPDFPMRGTFYIMSTNFFGAKGTLKQRLEYLISKGFEIGNQTKNHYALQNADSADKVIEEVGGFAKFVDDLIPGYVINSFSIPGGSMTKKYENYVYSGTYEGFSYENKGVVLLYGSKPTLSPINKELDLKKIPRVRVAGKDKVNNDFNYWIEYFDEHPEERYISDGNPDTFVINSGDRDIVKEGINIIIKN